MQSTKPIAIVLLSGGLDSATTLAVALKEGFRPLAVSFRYGQRHTVEVAAATAVAAAFHVTDHAIIDIDLRAIGGSALTSNLAVPKHCRAEEIGDGIPVTYVPARNTIFLSFALAWAEVVKAFDIFIGVNSLDYSGYPDCRPEYIAAFQKMANLATKMGVESSQEIRVHTPLIQLTKAEIIALGLGLGVDYSLTHSCYDPTSDGLACGACDSCLLRLRGFAELGLTDPARYSPPGDP